MLRKITEIKDIGKFLSHEGSNQSFKKFSGIFADNGMGKTTIASILRFLSENKPLLITGRRRLGSPRKPKVRLETDQGFFEFNETAWDKQFGNFEIFDTLFVNLNVFSGLTVDLSQRRKMYQFIIGDEAIKLNQEVVKLNTQISEYTSKIREQRGHLNKYIGNTFELDSFLNFEKIENIQEKIAAKTKELNALTSSDKINKLQSLKTIVLPSFNLSSLENIFKKSLPDVSTAAEEKTKHHVAEHLDQNGEGWIKKGLEYLENEQNCPFCKAQCDGNDLISAYKAYFNEEYIDFKDEISREKESFARLFQATLAITMKTVIESNERTVGDWKPYLEISLQKTELDGQSKSLILSPNDPAESINPFLNIVQALFLEKERTPLEIPPDFQKLDRTLSSYLNYMRNVQTYNAVVNVQNALIEKYKAGLSTGDVKTEQKSLNNLNGSLLRQREDVSPVCASYLDLLKHKETLELEKEKAQQNLEEATNKIPELYQDKINYYLERFGAQFYFVDHKKINPRGEPAVEYKLHINGCEIPLGDSSTPDDVASFKNTLSEGDKSTLAFSYFLAKLSMDARIAEKIIVFDDPISSQDNSRRERTKSFLSHFGRQAKQILLLSHDSKFLQEMYQWNKNDFSCFMIETSDHGSKLVNADFKDLNKTEHIWNFEKISNYHARSDGEPRDVVRSIRPLCEDFCRNRCPNIFGPSDTLGGMITMIESAVEKDEAFILKEFFVDLHALNQFTRPHAHGSEESPQINTTELKTNCKLLLSKFYAC